MVRRRFLHAKDPEDHAGADGSATSPGASDAKNLVGEYRRARATELGVKVNRHEPRIDRVRLLLSPKNQAWRKVVNDWFMPTT